MGKRFTCKLQCNKCAAPGCPRRVCIGLPYCKAHSRSLTGLQLKKSRSHGYDLFAAGIPGTTVFRKGDHIGRFGGELLGPAQLKKRYTHTEGTYVGELSRKRSRDGACRRSAVAMNNGASSAAKANARYKPTKDDLILVAKRDIKAGEEIKSWYGAKFKKGEKPPHKTVRTARISRPGTFTYYLD